MKNAISLIVTAAVVAGVVACNKKSDTEQPAKIQPRSDFAPEEFGIGRAHTRNFACNREIDIYLDEIRKCYNTHNTGACEDLQRNRTDKINRLKNSAHCRHGNAQK